MALNRNRPNRPKNYLAAAAGVIISVYSSKHNSPNVKLPKVNLPNVVTPSDNSPNNISPNVISPSEMTFGKL